VPRVYVNNGQHLSAQYPYLVDGVRAQSGTLGEEGCTAFFEAGTGTLTLCDYDGGNIYAAQDVKRDLHIKLVGDNNKIFIYNVSFGISNTGGGDISITAEEAARLRVTVRGSGKVRGITVDEGRSQGSITIGGKAEVSVQAETTATTYLGQPVAGLCAPKGVALEDSASLNITNCISNDLAGPAFGIYALEGPVNINTDGRVIINCGHAANTYGSVAIRTGVVTLPRAELLKLSWAGGGHPYSGELTYDPARFAVINDSTNRVATYRRGDPCDLRVINGFIDRGFGANDINTGQFLEDDEIKIYARGDIINYVFDHWSDTEYGEPCVNFINGTTVHSSRASFLMSPEEANLQANYRSTLFAVQPLFDRANSKVTWTLTQPISGGVLEREGELGWYSSIPVDGNAGEVAVLNTPGQQPGGTYRLKFIDNSGTPGFQEHYSEEFIIDWFDPGAVTGLTLESTAISLQVGESVVLTATVEPATATNKKVWWSSSDNDVVAVDDEGGLTAVGIGTASVEARTDEGNFTAYCEVTVSPVPVTGVTLDQTAISLGVSETVELIAAVLPANATNRNVFWQSDNPDVALVNQWGKVVGYSPGTTTIRVFTEDGGFSAFCQVTVLGSYYVTVINGSGSGTHRTGDAVVIKADDPPEGKIFHRWISSDGVTFASAKAAQTSFIMPDHTVTVEATFQELPDVTPGDLTGDGEVNVQDAIWLLRSIVGLVELTPAQEAAADVNGDGLLNVADAILILRYIVGLISSFTVAP
ncbi:MAG: hypothetical protein GX878_08325, partial [Firmicutes bacterium]|nr:hypothetical protein [Bacillota bacterium]